MIAAYGRPSEVVDALHDLRRKRPHIDQIPGDHHVIGLELRHVVNDGFQGGQIAMHVRQDGKSRHDFS